MPGSDGTGHRTEWRLSKAEEDARKWRIRSAKRIARMFEGVTGSRPVKARVSQQRSRNDERPALRTFARSAMPCFFAQRETRSSLNRPLSWTTMKSHPVSSRILPFTRTKARICSCLSKIRADSWTTAPVCTVSSKISANPWTKVDSKNIPSKIIRYLWMTTTWLIPVLIRTYAMLYVLTKFGTYILQYWGRAARSSVHWAIIGT